MRRRTFLAAVGTSMAPMMAGCMGVPFWDLSVHNIGNQPLTVTLELDRTGPSSTSIFTQFDQLTDNVPWKKSNRFEPGELLSESDLIKAQGHYELRVTIEEGPDKVIQFTIPGEAKPLNKLKGTLLDVGLIPTEIKCKHHPKITSPSCPEAENFGYSPLTPDSD